MSQYSSLSSWMDVAKYLLNEIGCPSEALVLTEQPVADVVGRSNIEIIGETWRLLAKETGDPAIGIVAAERYFQPLNWHALGLAILCSANLREALGRMTTLGDVVSDVTMVTVRESERTTELIMKSKVDSFTLGYEAADFGVASIVKLLRISFPGGVDPVEVTLQRPLVDDPTPYNNYFKAKVSFGGDCYKLTYLNTDLDQSLPMANSQLAKEQDRISAEYIATFNTNFNSTSTRVKNQILTMLENNEHPSLQGVAAKIGVGFRSMQRNLGDEGTSFKEILADARQQLALLYLKQKDIQLSEIAYLLGFSDHSNFDRAFKRWFGMPPNQYRERIAVSL